MPSSDVLELDNILYVSRLRKNLVLVSCMTNIHWRVSFEGQQCTTNDYSLANLRTLPRGVRRGGLYRLLVDLVALTHSSRRLVGPSISQKAHVELGFDPCTLIAISFTA